MKPMKALTLILVLSALAGTLCAQMRITETTQLDLPTEGMWGYGRFSPDGHRILFTTLSYAGIWSYDIRTEATKQITGDEGSGFGFAVSNDGRSIAFRRTIRGARWSDRKQEVVIADLTTGKSEALASARTLSTPAYLGDDIAYVKADRLMPSPPKQSGIFLQGIVDQKIMLIVDGNKRILDPLDSGSYIWPSLSPDRTSVLAYDMDTGAFISSVDGTVIRTLGRIEAPVWSRDGEWIISFSETNDGYRITGGELQALKSDGTNTTQLTATPDRIELFPSCSPTEDRIVCHTMDGKLLLMSYAVSP